MSAQTLPAVSCAKCSRRPSPGDLGWRISDPPMVVAGVAIGTCPTCVIGTTFDETDEETGPTCGGKCEGNYASKTGTYFTGVWGDSPYEDEWSCWDRTCVEGWLNEQGDECGSCGHYVSARIKEYRNGTLHGSESA